MGTKQVISNRIETRPISCTAFEGSRRIASGELQQVALSVKETLDRDSFASVLIFDDLTSEVIEVDFRGTPAEVLKRLNARAIQDANGVQSAELGESSPRSPGRPKLGVVAREVTLLPRHWDWLGRQPGGASVALRRLVEAARRDNAGQDRERLAREAAYRFMSAMAGNLPGFEEAIRALFGRDGEQFEKMMERWPVDVKEHSRKLAAPSFAAKASA